MWDENRFSTWSFVVNGKWQLALIVGLIATLAGCQRTSTEEHLTTKGGGSSDSPIARVTLISPVKRSLTRIVEQPGSIQADEATVLHARVPGYVGKRYVDIGQRVKAGELLLEVVAPELDNDLQEKEARERQAAAEIIQAQRAFTAAQAKTAEAKAGIARAEALAQRWKSENDRVASLVGRGVIDEQTRDETINQYRSAQASLEESRARVRSAEASEAKAEADVTGSRAKHDVARAEIGRAKVMVTLKKIVAPYDGIVTAREANEGDLIQPGRGQGLLSVARLDRVRAVVQVPEADAALVRAGDELTLSVLGRLLTAKVSRTSWALLPGSRTLRVEADIPNPDGTLRPGTYITARLTASLPETWTLPITAVARLGDVLAAYGVENGKAKQIPVEIGPSDGLFVEVRRQRKSATPAVWVPLDATERFVEKAAGLFDGRPVSSLSDGESGR